MGNIVVKSNDPLYRLDQIYQDIYSAQYPNDSSVIGDDLRGILTNLYDMKLNMLDTHKIRFMNPQSNGIVNTGIYIPDPETFYVYEGNGDNEILDSYHEVAGRYPEGILIGFLDSRLRDNEFRKKNSFILFSQMYYLAQNYIASVNNLNLYADAYRTYIADIPALFTLKKCIESGLDKNDFDVFVLHGMEYIFDNKDRFLKVMNSYDYTKIYKFVKEIPEVENCDLEYMDKIAFYQEEELNREFEEKYEAIKKDEEEETKKIIEESAEEIVGHILDDHATKIKNDLDENKNPKSGREFHVYMYNAFEDEDLEEIGLCIDAKSTKTQLDIEANYIYTTNTHYVSTDLIRRGYRIFIHMSKDVVHEMKIGKNDWTDREIKWAHKLETFLYNGEMK